MKSSFVEIACVEKVVLDRSRGRRDALAGHDQRDPGRVRHQHHGQRPAHEFVDVDTLHLAAHKAPIRISRQHGHLG